MTDYVIQLQGHLDAKWESLFDGFTIHCEYTPDHQPITVMTGQVVDQAALYGILSQFRHLGLTLISVQPSDGPCGD